MTAYTDAVGHARLEDLIAGVTPTYSDWTVDPTDGGDITDGDSNTFCTTGNRSTTAGWQYAHFEWDLGAFYNVLVSGSGHMTATAGDGYVYAHFWDGSSWQLTQALLNGTNLLRAFNVFGYRTSKVRISITSSAASTNAPYIRDFHVWRM